MQYYIKDCKKLYLNDENINKFLEEYSSKDINELRQILEQDQSKLLELYQSKQSQLNIEKKGNKSKNKILQVD